MSDFKLLFFFFLMLWLRLCYCSVRNDGKAIKGLKGKPSSLNEERQEVTNKNQATSQITRIPDNACTQIGKVVNSFRYELTNESLLPYKEFVDDVTQYSMEETSQHDVIYHVQLRLNESFCRTNNTTCDPYFDPAFLPFHGRQTQIIAPLESPLSHGKEIEIEGFIPMKSKGFQVTIQTGDKRPIEGQLRLNVKISSSETHINLEYFDESWNLHNHYRSSLRPKDAFKISIVCLSKKFEISINGKILASFDHILTYQDADHLSIFGEVTITKATGIGSYLPLDEYHPSESWLEDDIQYQTHPYIPFVAPLATKLALGKSIKMKGLIPMYSESFAITIQTGPDTEPKSAQLRLLAVFPKDSTQNKIRLWYFDGSWLGEQVATSTLIAGHAFQIAITCRADHFKIVINGQNVARYDYGLPIEQATHLSVLGMVNISEVVGIEEPPRVAFLDKPKALPYVVPLQNVTLIPGRNFKIWTYIHESSTDFWACFEDAGGDTIYISIWLSFSSSFFEWDTYENKKYGGYKRFTDLSWVKAGQPLHIELIVLEKAHKVIFNGLWSYEFENRLPINKTQKLNFREYSESSFSVLAVNGTSSTLPPLSPASPPPASRLCSVDVFYRKVRQQYWFRNLMCKSG